MSKTIVVQVTHRVGHQRYLRRVDLRKKFYAHDEFEVAEVGDTVRIVAARPRSKLKRWDLDEVLARHTGVVEFPSQYTDSRGQTRGPKAGSLFPTS